jgi:hypothetical protein
MYGSGRFEIFECVKINLLLAYYYLDNIPMFN